MNRWSALALFVIFAGALAFRLPKLDVRPLHNDEAVNAFKVTELWQDGRYRYDPDEYHGPTLHYATLPFLWTSGARGPDDLSDRTLRLAPVVFGAALILLLLFFTDGAGGLGRTAVAWSAIFIAISPAMVFYSRYFIHEMLLVFFTLLALGAGWRYTQRPGRTWAAIAGGAVGLMFATKETFVITIAAMGMAAVATAWRRGAVKAVATFVPRGHLLVGLGAAFLMWLLFFSSFFTNLLGPVDSIRTYLPWLKRAAGESPHLHPWYFYLQRLGWFHAAKGPVWSEGLVLGLAVAGAATGVRRNGSLLVFYLSVYTAALTAAYSLITYKTPWCLLSFYIGMILLAGVGAAAIVNWLRAGWQKAVVTLVLLGLTAQLAVQSWRSSYVYASDRRNPYVYAQAVPDILKLVERVEGIARVSPESRDMVVKIMAPQSDYWPLPWYLRRFKNTGWYQQVPSEPYSPVMIVSAKLEAQLDAKSERKWIMAGITELRPGRFFELYVELELWKKYVETLPPPPDE